MMIAPSVRRSLARCALVLGTALAAACGGSTSPTAPPTGDRVATVTLSPSTASLAVSETVQLTAATLSSSGAALSGRTVTYSSSATTVATVSTSGLVTAVAAGSATVTATSEGRSATATITVVSRRGVGTVVVTPATATVAQGASVPFSATVRDSAGTQLFDRTITWSSSDTTIFRVNASTGLATGVNPGNATITATVEGRTGTGVVTVTTVPVAQITIAPNGAALQVGGTRQFTATPRDGGGNPLDRPVTWSVRNPAVATVTPTGGFLTAVGAGNTFLLATAGGRTDSVAIGVTVGPPPVRTVVVNPTPITLLPNGTIKLRPLAFDAAGALLSNRDFTFTSGNTNVATVGADSTVRAGTGLGSTTITVTSEGVSATVPVSIPRLTSAYNIELVNSGPAFTAEVQTAFDLAIEYWQRAIIGDLQDVTFSPTQAPCSGNSVASRTVDDLLLFAIIDSIDGPGRVLGSAGPCYIRPGGAGAVTAIAGTMRFDSADVRGLINSGQFRDVIRHEMGHVLGIGTLWSSNSCIVDAANESNSQDTFYPCARGTSAFDAIGGATYTASRKVPIENCAPAPGTPTTCGAGTRNGHWREFTFDTELMTGFLDGGRTNANSVLTVASLADLGYEVNYGASEPYVLPGSEPALFGMQSRSTSRQLHLKDDILREPIYMVDRFGRILRTVQPLR